MTTVAIDDRPDGVRHISLNRPESRNALRRVEFHALIETFRAAESDDAVRAVVLSAAGPAFCAGGDLKETGQIGASSLDDHPVHEFTDRLSAFGKPLLAAVHGAAVGFGFTMLLHADLVVAGPEASFAAPFARLGVPTEAGSSYLLQAVAGPRVAARMLLLGERIGAREALEHGLISHLVDGDPTAVLAATLEQAGRLSGFRAGSVGPTAVGLNKALLRAARADLVAAALTRERTALAEQLRVLSASTG